MRKNSQIKNLSREEKLEERLREGAKIKFKDRLKNIKYNVGYNSDFFVILGITSVLMGGCAGSIYGMKHESKKTPYYSKASSYVSGIESHLTRAYNAELENPFQEHILGHAYGLVEKNSKIFYQEEGKEILDLMDDNPYVFGKDYDSKKTLKYVQDLSGKLNSVDQTGWSIVYTIASVATGLFSLFAGLYTAVELVDEVSWSDQLKEEKKHKARLEEKLNILKNNLEQNPNKKQFYDFAETITKKSDLNEINLTKILLKSSELNRQEYAPFLEILKLDSHSLKDSYHFRKKLETYEDKINNKGKRNQP